MSSSRCKLGIPGICSIKNLPGPLSGSASGGGVARRKHPFTPETLWLPCQDQAQGSLCLQGVDLWKRRVGRSNRLDGVLDWEEVSERIEESYRMAAPKRLQALFTDPRQSASSEKERF